MLLEVIQCSQKTEAMKKSGSGLVIGFIVVTFFLSFSGCENNMTTGEGGLLTGTISIGPICPVETVPPSPACRPTAETYKAYPVGVYSADGIHKIKDISPALDGSYNVALAPGRYLVVLERANNIGKSNLPVTVFISSMQQTVLNINIDTGIR